MTSIGCASRRVVVAVLAGLARTPVGHEIGAASYGRDCHGLCAALRRAGHLCLGTVKEKTAPVDIENRGLMVRRDQMPDRASARGLAGSTTGSIGERLEADRPFCTFYPRCPWSPVTSARR